MASPTPSFAAPPVTEVVIAARFKTVDAWHLAPLGSFVSSLRPHGFVREEQRPGFEAPTERFGPASLATPLGLELITGPPPVRHWLLNGDGDELLQLQPNWFACNWRKVAPDAVYGRWESRWTAFERWISKYEAELNGGALQYDQVEVTYVNHVEPNDVWSSHKDAHKVFRFLSEDRDPLDAFLPETEQTSADLRYVIKNPDDDADAIGRLNVSLKPGFQQQGSDPVFVFTLVARGRPLGEGLPGVRKFAELAHEWIVRGFAELTTAEMHRAWQRETPAGAEGEA